MAVDLDPAEVLAVVHEDAGMDEAHTAPDHLTASISGVPVDASIYSRDDQLLGTVKEVRDRCFLVNARLPFDYWLSSRCVAAVGDGHVVLAVDKRQVADYLIDVDCPDDDVEA